MTDDSENATDLEKLKVAARVRWGGEWAVQQLHWADGTTSVHAYRNHGLNEDGYLQKERLFVGADGQVYHDSVLIDKARVVDILEQDDVPPEIQGEIIHVDKDQDEDARR